MLFLVAGRIPLLSLPSPRADPKLLFCNPGALPRERERRKSFCHLIAWHTRDRATAAASLQTVHPIFSLFFVQPSHSVFISFSLSLSFCPFSSYALLFSQRLFSFYTSSYRRVPFCSLYMHSIPPFPYAL